MLIIMSREEVVGQEAGDDNNDTKAKVMSRKALKELRGSSRNPYAN